MASQSQCSEALRLVNNSRDACRLVMDFDPCQYGDIIEYPEVVYCSFSTVGVGIFVLECSWNITLQVVVLIVVFIAMGLVADGFFAPNLATIVDQLKISQNLAGVTFLALGNGVADVFSSIAATTKTTSHRPNLMFGALLGGTMFVTTVVVAMIVFHAPFTVMSRPFLRDVIFYLWCVFFSFYLLYDRKITVAEAIVLTLLYVFYVLLVVGGQEVRKRMLKKRGIDVISTDFNEARKISDVQMRSRAHSNASTMFRSRAASNASAAFRSRTQTNASRRSAAEEMRSRVESNASRISRANEETGTEVEESTNTPKVSRIVSFKRRKSIVTQDAVVTHEDLPSPISEELPPIVMRNVDEAQVIFYEEDEEEEETRHETNGHISNALELSVLPTVCAVVDTAETEWRNGAAAKKSSQASSRKSSASKEGKKESTSNWPARRKYSSKMFTQSTKYRFSVYLSAIWLGVRPFTLTSLKGLKWYSVAWQIVQFPLLVIMNLTIPLVSMDLPLSNWNQPLLALQLFLFPILAVACMDYSSVSFSGFSINILAVIIGLILALLVIFLTRFRTPPKYHKLFAYPGFVISMLYMYRLASEVVSMLQTIGAVFHISQGILGITVLTWANSIGDTVANNAVVKEGFSRMAFSACIGAPIFNLLVGAGISFIISTTDNGGIHNLNIDFTPLERVLVLFLGISLLFSLIAVPLQGFYVRKWYAVALLLLYAVFVVVAVLTETGTLPPIGAFVAENE